MKKYVLITGCDSGFGLRLMQTIVESESDLAVIACFHSEKGINSVAYDSRLRKFQVDITSDTSVSELKRNVINLIKNENVMLIGIVNNAGGLLGSGPLEWSDMNADKAQMDLNFFGTVRITREFLPLIRHSRGRIVMVSSILGLVATPLGASYSASKFALEGWTDALRREMLPFGVRVCLIEPGMFKGTSFYKRYTSLSESAWTSLNPELKEVYGTEYKEYVLRRLVGLRDYFGDRDIDKPVRAMLHALISPFPKHRYRVGTDCVFYARIIGFLPTCISDIAMTLSDVVVTLDWGLFPVFPEAVTLNTFQIMIFAIFGYCFNWLAILVGLVALGTLLIS